ncbi:MAG TPA: caspase family protein [Nitriliruptorales bacterium]|nr:caspase family protein [Nitriliruptorales bacterium]
MPNPASLRGVARHPRVPRLLAGTMALLLVVQLAVITLHRLPSDRPVTVAIEDASPTDPASSPRSPTGERGPQPVPPAPPALPDPAAAAPAPAAGGAGGPATGPPAPADSPVVVIDAGEAANAGGPPPPPPPPPPAQPAAHAPAAAPAQGRFAQAFPAQEQAVQDAADPATTRWAVLIGVNEYAGSTRDNVGSRQDAEELYAHLRGLGWRDDHMVLLVDGAATYQRIADAIGWLARKTDGASVAAVHFSGHTKQWFGADVDGDGEVPDEALWPTDNRHMTDRELTDRLAAVAAGRLWIDVGACEAAGYADPGLRRAGRLLTFSSAEPEKSYEDPSVGNSVWGYYLVDQALRRGVADANGDGDVTVQEAFHSAAPRAAQRTAGASHGPQHPQMFDDVGEPFTLRIPPPPPPPPDPAPSPAPSDEDDGCGLLICPPRPPTRSR